ncbi:probable histone-lysine N-methyltransferase set-23 [Chelonus insularis]|uniref:probable histone-lysine N-methyltransferase set-23 n=1 Tax=Chelonus insularis TaxID=460826 RepID=UPI0015890107|nr:probable histone-lysine N-methyltransferase set-23 [Chelonus insularis]
MDTGCGREDEYEHPICNVMYVANNIPGKGINIDEFESEFSVGCMCKIQCLQNCPCVREHVNYINNRFNEEKSSKLILECNPTCSCSNNCGNRLVQHGPLDCLQIIKTEDKGFGLITSKHIKKNQFICEYAGEIIGIEEARRRVEENKLKKEMNYTLIVSEYVGDKKMTTCIDPKYLGNIGRYCNHSCQPSAKLVPVRVEKLTPRLCLFACRDIEIGEEITFNYGGDNEKSIDNISEIPCLCQSDNCIGFLPHHLF